MDLLEQCRQHAHNFYTELLAAAAKSLHESLFEQSKQSESNAEQTAYFEAMQQLQQHNQVFHQQFAATLNEAFQRFKRGEDQQTSLDQQIDISKLTLVQRDKLEDDLAITVMISKANSRNTEALWKLNRRLAVLRRGQALTDELNPFAPEIVCRALQEAVHTLDVDSEQRLFIYKQLGKLFVLSFEKILDELNQLLAMAGILANLKFTIQQPRQAEVPVTEQRSTEAVQQHQLYKDIRSLQQQGGPRTHTASGISWGEVTAESNAGSPFSAMDYALILSTIQQSNELLKAVQSGKPLSIDRVEKKLIEKLQQQPSQGVSRDDADMVDLVGMIFRYMLDDENLDDSVKSLLSHLHTPFLKLALMNNDFVDELDHPARRLLNEMAELGAQWVEDDNDRAVLPKIRSTVEIILQNFVDDEQLFDDLLTDFVNFRISLEKRAAMIEQRNAEAQQGMERLEVARQRAADELSGKLAGVTMAESIQQPLLKNWTDFLAFQLLRHGDQSSSWSKALQLIDTLVSCLRASSASDQLQALQQLQQGLDAIGYQPEDSTALLDAVKLAQSQLTVSEAKKPAAASPAKVAPPTPREKKKPVDDEAELNAKERRILGTLKEIAFGTWFEFRGRRGADDFRRLKLAWYSKISKHYMFVDHSGVKQAVETRAGLARGMAAGNIRFATLEKRSFMERALETILSTLKMAE